MDKKTEVVTIRIDPNTKIKLTEYANEKDWTISKTISNILKEWSKEK